MVEQFGAFNRAVTEFLDRVTSSPDRLTAGLHSA
jgi:hypothetical protein